MGRGSYVLHNAFFDSGGPWGNIQAVLAAYIEERTGRSFRSFFESFTSASIGGVNAIALGLGIPAKTLAHAEYACCIDLFRDKSGTIVRNQYLNKSLGMHVWKDHHDHMLLYHTLAPHFAGGVMNDVPLTLLVAAHNMDLKMDLWFGRMDPALFDERALKKVLINGTTPLLDAAMATTSIPGVFRPWEFNGQHYRDFGPAISAGNAHKEIDASLQAKHAALVRARSHEPLTRRDALRFGFSRSSQAEPRTLTNAENAVVRTLFLGTGDLSDLPYTKAVQNNAGFIGAVDDQEYSAMHMVKRHAQQEERADMERYFDVRTQHLTGGQPAITRINKSLVWNKENPLEREIFPNLSQTDCSRENLHKIFYFAGLNIEQHMTTIASVLQEITINQLAQGKIDRAEYDRMSAVCAGIAKESPWPLLEKSGILVTAHNGPGIYETFRARVPQTVQVPAPRKTIISRAASVAGAFWRKPTATVS